MNISKLEQRVLHALAQGGSIRLERDIDGALIALYCYTREGFVLSDCTYAVFKKLKARRLVESKEHGPYRISYLGRASVRAQLDNR